MRSALVSFIALAAVATTAAATPPTYAPWPGGRSPVAIHKCEGGRVLAPDPQSDRLRDRLIHAAHDGRLPPGQAHRLRRELRRLDRDEASACAKGYVTDPELHGFDARLRRLADHLTRPQEDAPPPQNSPNPA